MSTDWARRSNRSPGQGNPIKAPLVMHSLPMHDGSAVVRRTDWGSAIGNLEDAKLAMEAIKGLVDDAVFLDEEAYALAGNVAAHQDKILALQRRLRDAENQVTVLRAEVSSKDAALVSATAALQLGQRRIADMEQELENNSVVFEMHYKELLTRNEEIERLKATVEQLQAASAR